MSKGANDKKRIYTMNTQNISLDSDLDNNTYIVNETVKFVRNTLDGEATGHDWWHIHRVRNLSLKIAYYENANDFIVELAALLHDIADWKFTNGDENVGPKIAKEWLESLNVSSEVVQHVCEIIKTISFKGAGDKTKMLTIEGMIVQDADRIDALGAIGIARCLAYGGYKGNQFYNPDIPIIMHENFEEYKNSKSTSINHFYEKLLLLKDRMNTKMGKEIAYERHEFMQQYLDQFFAEWNG